MYSLFARGFGEFEHSRQAQRCTSRWLPFIPVVVGIIAALLKLSWPLWEKLGKASGAFTEVVFPGLLFTIAIAEHGGFTGHGGFAGPSGLAVFWGLLLAGAVNGIFYCGLTWLALILWRAVSQ